MTFPEDFDFDSVIGKNDTVLLCCDSSPDDLARAVEKTGAECIVWQQDRRWKTLLRLAFSHRVNTVVGNWRYVLGLAKLARATATPLRVRNVILTDPAPDAQLTKGICDVLDCRLIAPCGHGDAAGRELLAWYGVLDYRIEKTQCGLALEMVTFRGQHLPELPATARRLIRFWNPEEDIPFFL